MVALSGAILLCELCVNAVPTNMVALSVNFAGNCELMRVRASLFFSFKGSLDEQRTADKNQLRQRNHVALPLMGSWHQQLARRFKIERPGGSAAEGDLDDDDGGPGPHRLPAPKATRFNCRRGCGARDDDVHGGDRDVDVLFYCHWRGQRKDQVRQQWHRQSHQDSVNFESDYFHFESIFQGSQVFLNGVVRPGSA